MKAIVLRGVSLASLENVLAGRLISFCASVVFIPDLAQSFAKTWGKESIKALLQPYELRTFNFDYTPSHVHHLQDLVRYDAIERLAKKLLIDLRQVNAQEPGRRFAPRFVAHGYGGLICELVRDSLHRASRYVIREWC